MGDDYVEQGSLYRNDIWKRAVSGALPLYDVAYRQFWKNRFFRYLSYADAYVATSPEARDIILQQMPGLDAARFLVIPHGRDFPAMRNLQACYVPGEPLRLLVIGNLGFHKGKAIIENLSAYDKNNLDILQFHIMGNSSGSNAGIKRYGIYERDKLSGMVANARPHAALIFSIWSETWCHTLTELWSMGIPAIVLDIGTVARRVRESGCGWAIPYSDIPEIYRDIVSICSDAQARQKAAAAIAKWQSGEGSARTVAAMSMDYYRLYHAVLNNRPPQTALSSMPLMAVSAKEYMGSAYLRAIDPCANDFKRDVAYMRVDGPRLRACLQTGCVDGVIIQRDWLNKTLARECLRLARAKQIPVCFEVDDDLQSVPNAPARNREHVRDLIKQANVVMVTNKELASRAANLNSNTCIRESLLARHRWPSEIAPRIKDGYLRAMYYGTPSHVADLRMILPAVAAIHAKYPFFRLALVRIGEDMGKLIEGLDYIECYDVPSEDRPLPKFTAYVASLLPKMDFAIAPLIDNYFNAAKSYIKVVEYGALGLAAIASKVSPYTEATHIPNILLCDNTGEAWAEALERRILLGKLNRAQGLETWHYVQANYMHGARASADLDSIMLDMAGKVRSGGFEY